MEITKKIKKNYPYALEVIAEESNDLDIFCYEKTFIGSEIEPTKIYKVNEEYDGSMFYDYITREGWLVSQEWKYDEGKYHEGQYIIVQTAKKERKNTDFEDETERWWNAHTLEPLKEELQKDGKYSLSLLSGNSTEWETPKEISIGSEIEPIKVYENEFRRYPYVEWGNGWTYIVQKDCGYIIRQNGAYYIIIQIRKEEPPTEYRKPEYSYSIVFCELTMFSKLIDKEAKINFPKVKDRYEDMFSKKLLRTPKHLIGERIKYTKEEKHEISYNKKRE